LQQIPREPGATGPSCIDDEQMCGFRWHLTDELSDVPLSCPKGAPGGDLGAMSWGELLRANKARGLARLDALAARLEYLPLTTAAMRQAAVFWAQARQQGRPTADARALDGDVILAAQAMTLGATDVVMATTNVGHLSRFAPAALWPDITAAS
jgi:predicted nucleic acid-binding protein